MELTQYISFDQRHAQALRRIWLAGDVHGQFGHIELALRQAAADLRPSWLVFLGDLDLDFPLRQGLEPLRAVHPGLQIAFIHGNHDADSHARWAHLQDGGDVQLLHGRVLEIEGIRIAGLGGHFLGRVWRPPAKPRFLSRAAVMSQDRSRNGQQLSPRYLGAIYPEDVEQLVTLTADILVSHEAPSCHRYGFAVLDDLARRLGAVRCFHGHHHVDCSAEYVAHRNRLGFDAHCVGYRAIKNGLGENVLTSNKSGGA